MLPAGEQPPTERENNLAEMNRMSNELAQWTEEIEAMGDAPSSVPELLPGIPEEKEDESMEETFE